MSRTASSRCVVRAISGGHSLELGHWVMANKPQRLNLLKLNGRALIKFCWTQMQLQSLNLKTIEFWAFFHVAHNIPSTQDGWFNWLTESLGDMGNLTVEYLMLSVLGPLFLALVIVTMQYTIKWLLLSKHQTAVTTPPVTVRDVKCSSDQILILMTLASILC